MPRGDPCACRGCCVFPNGSTAIMALIVSLCAYFMGVFANNGCFFVTVDLSNAVSDEVSNSISGLQSVGFGIWTRENPVQNYCVVYTDLELNALVYNDASWKASRAMASLAQISGIVVMIICICLSCMSIPQVLLKLTAVLSMFAGLFESLTFVYFSSQTCEDFNCQFSRGAGVAIGAALLYLINGCLLFKVPPHQGDDDDDAYDNAVYSPTARPATATNDPPPGSVQVVVTELPDGTKKTTRTVVNDDGSKTVTETIEHPATAAVAGAEPVASATVLSSDK